MQTSTEKEQAVRLCHRTIELVKQFDVPPLPRNYELFFLGSTGEHPELTRIIDEKLQSGSRFSAHELEKLYARWVGDTAITNGLSLLGGRLGDEVRDALALITEAATSTTDFNDSLARVETSLGNFSEPQQVKEAVATLVRATKQMSGDSARLKEKLAESTDQINRLQKDLENFQVESQTDPLTGIANRKYFDQQLVIAITEAKESGEPLCLSMVDVDHFKRFNDKFGHQTGDSVLRLVSSIFRDGVRDCDLAARFGGEEFAIILRNVDLTAAAAIVTELRATLTAKELIRKSTSESLGRITASFGVEQHRPDDTPESLIARADYNLYAAKRAGRDRVVAVPAPDTGNAEQPVHAG